MGKINNKTKIFEVTGKISYWPTRMASNSGNLFMMKSVTDPQLILIYFLVIYTRYYENLDAKTFTP